MAATPVIEFPGGLDLEDVLDDGPERDGVTSEGFGLEIGPGLQLLQEPAYGASVLWASRPRKTAREASQPSDRTAR
jgi:hypothetical protein